MICALDHPHCYERLQLATKNPWSNFRRAYATSEEPTLYSPYRCQPSFNPHRILNLYLPL